MVIWPVFIVGPGVEGGLIQYPPICGATQTGLHGLCSFGKVI